MIDFIWHVDDRRLKEVEPSKDLYIDLNDGKGFVPVIDGYKFSKDTTVDQLTEFVRNYAKAEVSTVDNISQTEYVPDSFTKSDFNKDEAYKHAMGF